LRGGIRSFSIDAIENTMLLDKDAKDIDREQLLKQMQSGYGIFGGQAKAWAELKFSVERARWVQHEEWHPEQRGSLHKDGTYTLEVPYSDERELIGDILRMGTDVKVMGPAELIKQVKAIVQSMLKKY
jgi:predicted DNA-binding transcriptional regulator YafY